MKKIIFIILVLMLTLGYSTLCLAATENVVSATYDEDETVITDDNTPLSGSTSEATFEEESVPQGAALAQTGGIPAEVFYVMGALFIVAAIVVSRKKENTSTK